MTDKNELQLLLKIIYAFIFHVFTLNNYLVFCFWWCVTFKYINPHSFKRLSVPIWLPLLEPPLNSELLFCDSFFFLKISPCSKLPSSLPPLPLYDQPPISPFTSPEISTPPPLPRSPSTALNGEHKLPLPAASYKGQLSTHSEIGSKHFEAPHRLKEMAGSGGAYLMLFVPVPL